MSSSHLVSLLAREHAIRRRIEAEHRRPLPRTTELMRLKLLLLELQFRQRHLPLTADAALAAARLPRRHTMLAN